ncbi:MAG: DUF642 domain-containing protein [Verrucomicrobiota bacterium]
MPLPSLSGTWILALGFGFSVVAQNGVSRFEEPNLSQGSGTYYGEALLWYRTLVTGDVLDGWLVSNGTVDLIRHEAGTSREGSQSLDLNGNNAGTIERRFATVPGKFYRLDFDFSGNPINGGTRILFVSVNGAVRDRFEWVTADIGNSYQVDMKWQRRTVAFEATSDSTLIELSSGAGGLSGPEVDNLAFYLVEPPTLKIENAILISWNLPPWGLADTVIEVANQAGGPWEPIEAAVQSLAADGVIRAAIPASGTERYYRIRSKSGE